MKSRNLLLIGAAYVMLLMGIAPIAAASEPSFGQVEEPVTTEQLQSMKDAVDSSLFGEPSLEATAQTKSILWRCDAWPAYQTAYSYYWVHWDVNYARYQALSLCNRAYGGYVCNYTCNYTYVYP